MWWAIGVGIAYVLIVALVLLWCWCDTGQEPACEPSQYPGPDNDDEVGGEDGDEEEVPLTGNPDTCSTRIMGGCG
jgi:hypothetical protein